jgi:hypothetical protein
LLHRINVERVVGGIANRERAAPGNPAMVREKMDRRDRDRDEGDRREPMRFTFLPHALEDMEERNVSDEWVRATVEEPDFTGEGDCGRLVVDRRFGRIVVRVVYNVGRGGVRDRRRDAPSAPRWRR